MESTTRLTNTEGGQENNVEKILIKDSKNAHITHSDNTKIKECAQRGSMQNNGNSTKSAKGKSAQIFVWFFAMMTLCLGMCLGLTFGALKDSKTATGVISIVLPPTAGVSGSYLYYDFTNQKIYQGMDTNGNVLTADTIYSPKLVLANTQSGSSAYIKLEMNLLGMTTLNYNTSGTTASFSDSTTLATSTSNGIVTLTTQKAVAQYAYMFLDNVLSNLRVKEVLTNATLQIKASVSLDANFASSSSNYLYYNFTTSDTMVDIPTGTNYTINAVTQSPTVGQPYTFEVATDVSCNKTAPVVKVNGVALTASGSANGVYTYTIASLQGGENITITPVINTYTITVSPTGDSPSGASTTTITLSYGDYIIKKSGDVNLYYRKSGGSNTVIYTGTSGSRYSVSSYSLDDGITMVDKEYIVTSDMSIQAYWSYSGGGTPSPAF